MAMELSATDVAHRQMNLELLETSANFLVTSIEFLARKNQNFSKPKFSKFYNELYLPLNNQKQVPVFLKRIFTYLLSQKSFYQLF